jgi:hypothetical protein
VTWDGTGVVGGGLSTFYTVGSAGAMTSALKTLFEVLKSQIPPSVSINIPAGGETINSTDGVLMGAWTATPVTVVVGTGNGPFAGGVGGRIVWQTAGITRGRRVRGSTYLVPLHHAAYDTNGSMSDAIMAGFPTPISAFVTALSPDFVIWSRPSAAGATDGAAHPVLSGAIDDATSWLRTRRT